MQNLTNAQIRCLQAYFEQWSSGKDAGPWLSITRGLLRDKGLLELGEPNQYGVVRHRITDAGIYELGQRGLAPLR